MPANHGEMESRLWAAADQLWANSNLKPSEYSTPVLGLIFLRYADHRFTEAEKEIGPIGTAKPGTRRTVSKADCQARGVLALRKEARFASLQKLPEGADLAQAVNNAMKAIEAENEELKDVLPKTYKRLFAMNMRTALRDNHTQAARGAVSSRGRKGSFMPRVLTAVTLLLASMALGGTPSVAWSQETQPAAVRAVAVVGLKNLQNREDLDWIGEGAAESLTTRLAGVPGLRTIERAQVQKIIAEQDFTDAGGDAKAAAKLGKIIGAERLVMGTFVQDGENLMFNVRVVDAKTDEVLSSASVTTTRSKIFDAYNQLSDAVVQSFDRKVVMVDNRPVVTEAAAGERITLTEAERARLHHRSTDSVEAMEALNRGLAATDNKERLKFFTQAIVLDPNFAYPYYWRALAYDKLGEPDKALADYSRAIEADGECIVAMNNRGVIYGMRGEHQKALADYNRALEINSTYALAMTNRGSLYAKMGQYDLAERDINQAIALEPEDTDRYGYLISIYSDKHDYEQVLKMAGKMLEKNPKSAYAHIWHGVALQEMKRYKEAIDWFTKAIALNPRHAATYQKRGLCNVHLGQMKEAFADIDRAIELRPSDGNFYVSRANVFADAGRHEEALRDYSKAIELGPNVGRFYSNRATVYTDMKEWDKAWFDVKKAEKLGAKVDETWMEALRKGSGRSE